MAKEKEKLGRPKTLVRRHVLEVKEDTREWIEETISQFTEKRSYGRNSRVIGAGIAAAGIYTMVRLIDQFGRGIVEGVKGLAADVFTGVSIPVINFFTSIFGVRVGVGEPTLETAPAISELEELGQFDPFAFGAALTAGGMILAGQNPGEILKGIGSIIDALIPL